MEYPSAPGPPVTDILLYGGIAVAVIFAMSRYSETLIRSISKLVEDVNRQRE